MLSISQEIKMKSTMKYNYTVLRMAKMKKPEHIKPLPDCEGVNSHTLLEGIKSGTTSVTVS